MNIKYCKETYATATDRKAIKYGLSNHLTDFATKKKKYKVHNQVENKIEIRIYETRKNDYGNPYETWTRVYVYVN